MKHIYTYHGGKYTIRKWVVDNFPHNLNELSYFEPFFGSGAVFFELCERGIIKNRKQTVINDLNDNITNFFKVLRNNGEALREKLMLTPYARKEYYDCYGALKSSDISDLERARCFYVVQNSSFMGVGTRISRPGFATEKKSSSRSGAFYRGSRGILNFREAMANTNTTIENLDAIKLIEKYDHDDAFFYLDPPYVTTECAYSDAYTLENFKELVGLLGKIKGKFAMSNYPDILEVVPELKKYHCVDRRQDRLAKDIVLERTEILIMNYEKKEVQGSFEF